MKKFEIKKQKKGKGTKLAKRLDLVLSNSEQLKSKHRISPKTLFLIVYYV